MRKQFVEYSPEINAYDVCPWASVVEIVEGGWMCFESWDDYNVWKAQV